MIILYPGNQPRYYLDRNSINADIFYGASNAPHGDTQRVIYTVPAGRKAIVQGFNGFVQRDTVAAPVGTVYLDIIYQFGAGDAKIMTYCRLLTNVAGDRQTANESAFTLLTAGKTLSIRTADSSTGGSVFYFAHISILEFDG